MKAISLFSGIDGFSLAAEEVGWEVVAHCEIEPFARMILEYLYPNATLHGDITTTDFTIYHGRVNVLFGGFPCQPVSVAGKREGVDDERFLWKEMLRAIREISPRWVVAENVRGLLSQSGGVVFEQVCVDLEAEGYEVQTFLLPAAGVGAPHERYRIVIVGYSEHAGLDAAENRGNDHKPPQQARQDTQRQPSGTDSLQSGAGAIEYTKFATDGRHNAGASSGEGLGMERHQLDKTGRKQSTDNTESSSSNATDTPKQGRKIWEQDHGRAHIEESATGLVNEPERHGCEQPFTNPSSPRRKEYDIPEITSRQGHTAGRNNEYGNYWENFPTQSPICTGNDGFPTESLRQRIRADSMGVISEEEIDKILSKAYTDWVKGTIKAGGNAVVPQLFLQVFKAINQYENLYHT